MRGELFPLARGCVAFLEQLLDALAVGVDVGFQLGDGARFPAGIGCGGGGHLHDLRCGAGEFQFPGQLGAREIGGFELRLEVLERAGNFRFAIAGSSLEFTAQRGIRLLQLGRGLRLQPVGGGELALEFHPVLALLGDLLRALALAAFEDGDTPVQLLELALIFLLRTLRPGTRGGGVSHQGELRAELLRIGELLGELCLLAGEGVAFATQGVEVLLCFFQALAALGCDALLEVDLLQLVLNLALCLLQFPVNPVAIYNDRLALLAQGGDRALVFTLHADDLAVRHVAGAQEFVAGQPRVFFGARRRRQIDDWRLHCGRCGEGLRGFAGGSQLGDRRCGLRFGGDDVALRALAFEPLREGLGGEFGKPRALLRATGFAEQLHHFLPGEADVGIVRHEHFAAKDLRHPVVDLGERDGRLSDGDEGGHRVDLEAQLRMDLVRPGVEELRRDAVQEVAEFQDHLVLIDLRLLRLAGGIRRPLRFREHEVRVIAGGHSVGGDLIGGLRGACRRGRGGRGLRFGLHLRGRLLRVRRVAFEAI